jgi:hypothetical protein
LRLHDKIPRFQNPDSMFYNLPIRYTVQLILICTFRDSMFYNLSIRYTVQLILICTFRDSMFYNLPIRYTVQLILICTFIVMPLFIYMTYHTFLNMLFRSVSRGYLFVCNVYHAGTLLWLVQYLIGYINLELIFGKL